MASALTLAHTSFTRNIWDGGSEEREGEGKEGKE
jgi:hypothetical protein